MPLQHSTKPTHHFERKIVWLRLIPDEHAKLNPFLLREAHWYRSAERKSRHEKVVCYIMTFPILNGTHKYIGVFEPNHAPQKPPSESVVIPPLPVIVATFHRHGPYDRRPRDEPSTAVPLGFISRTAETLLGHGLDSSLKVHAGPRVPLVELAPVGKTDRTNRLSLNPGLHSVQLLAVHVAAKMSVLIDSKEVKKRRLHDARRTDQKHPTSMPPHTLDVARG